MSGLAHHFAREGIATATISLVREHAEVMRPPRSLWVPFPLGRPLGPPATTPAGRAFQLDVLRSLLGLFETVNDRMMGPTIVDYPHDAPEGVPESEEGEVWACPVSLPRPAPASEREALQASLDGEVALLLPWYEEARRERGRTSVGVSGLGVGMGDVGSMTEVLARYAFGEEVVAPAGTVRSMPELVKYVADDLKAIYSEATVFRNVEGAAVNTDPRSLQRWLFGETVLGETLYRVAERMRESDDKATRGLVLFLIPTALERR